ncbi:winged helix-turn-helix domain-containing protein [Cryobacterium sp. PAMC25264]|nr:winged helix-turn-helix domain-containing protein [Cryobacterium sp. PAMC25264]
MPDPAHHRKQRAVAPRDHRGRPHRRQPRLGRGRRGARHGRTRRGGCAHPPGRRAHAAQRALPTIRAAGVVIDEASYSAKVHGKPLDLTYKEFELLRFLAAHPSRVFTREQLLSEVWGYDYFGGTRTVDVHVRRLRAKLGDQESLIGTVRNVGYRFNVYEEDGERVAHSVGS